MIRINYTLGSRGTANFASNDLKRDTATAFRFDTDDPIVILNETGATTLFNGSVITVRDRPILPPNVGTESAVDCADATRFFDDVIIEPVTFPSGTTMRDVVDHVAAELAWLGVTRDLGMAPGPPLDGFTIDLASATEVLNELSRVTGGYPWRLTPSLVIEMALPGTWTAAFSLTSSNGKIWDGLPSWAKSKKQKINRVYVKYGGERQVEKSQSFTATAGQTVFTLDYPAVGPNLRGYITVNGVFTPLGAAPWTWNAVTNSINHATGATAGTIVSVDAYDAQFPLTAKAENGSAATAPLSKRFEYPNIFDKDEAQQIADGLLARYEVAPRVVTIKTRAGFEMPGTMMTLNIPERGISSGSWLITAVNIRTDKDQKYTYEYTLAEGTQAVDSWVDSFRQLLGNSKTGGTGSVSGELLPLATGMFGTEVIAHSGRNSHPHESRLGTVTNASLQGPAVIMGRQDGAWSWGIVADHLAVSPDIQRLRFVPLPESGGERFVMQLTQANSPADGVYYLTPNTIGSLYLGASTSAIGLGYRITGGYFTDFDVTNGLTEQGRTVKNGFWTTYTPTVSINGAGNSISVGSTVYAGYTHLSGKTMRLDLYLAQLTIANGLGTSITVTMPAGMTIAHQGSQDAIVYDNHATNFEHGLVFFTASGTSVQIFRQNAAAYSASAAVSSVRCAITLELQ